MHYNNPTHYCKDLTIFKTNIIAIVLKTREVIRFRIYKNLSLNG